MPSSNNFSASSRSRSSDSSWRTIASSRSSCLLNSAIHLSIAHAQPKVLAARELGDRFQYSTIGVPGDRVAAGQHSEWTQGVETCAVGREPCAGNLEPVIHATIEPVRRPVETLDDVSRRD